MFSTYDMGEPNVDVIHTLRLAADLEDSEIIAKMQTLEDLLADKDPGGV